jgi:hypothetical protein
MNDAFKISAIMSIALCAYMMIFYNVIINYQEADFSSSRIIGLTRFALSLIQLSMALVYAYYWLRFKIWEHPERKSREGEAQPLQEETQEETNQYVKVIVDKVKYLSRMSHMD